MLRPLATMLLIASTLLACCAWAHEQPLVASLLELRQQNVVIQKWDLSCGAAALATLLRYQLADSVSEREVAKGLISRAEYIARPELVRIREGFSMLDLKRYVETRGYRGEGYGKLELDDLIERAPIIVPIKAHGYNHFVVFRGVRGNRVLLADPAWGNRTMSTERFMRSWIEFPTVGRCGFVALRRDGVQPPAEFAPRLSEFVILK
jgi:uncharacterized protein